MKTILHLTIFSIAMGLLEAVVVIYLRELYYPEGFHFPLKMMDPHIAVIEICREAATLIMLLMISFLATSKRIVRFALFLLSFAIWDIFYYVFLKLFIGWPESLFTWDILFLIPIAWVGPVIAPIINALTMMLLALLIIYYSDTKGIRMIPGISWILLILGSLITVFVYIQDYGNFMLQEFSLAELFSSARSDEVLRFASTYIPQSFNWYLFLAGELAILSGIAFFISRKASHVTRYD